VVIVVEIGTANLYPDIRGNPLLVFDAPKPWEVVNPEVEVNAVGRAVVFDIDVNAMVPMRTILHEEILIVLIKRLPILLLCRVVDSVLELDDENDIVGREDGHVSTDWKRDARDALDQLNRRLVAYRGYDLIRVDKN
jgi:hypothetical protein